MEHQRMKWEYKVHLVDNDGDGASTFSIDYLNELGEDGWELLHVKIVQILLEGSRYHLYLTFFSKSLNDVSITLKLLKHLFLPKK